MIENILNADLIRSRTIAARDACPPAAAAYDDKTTAIINALKAGDFGCQQASVYKLVGAMIGIDIPVSPSSANSKPFIEGTLVYETQQRVVLVSILDSDGDAYYFPTLPTGGSSYILRSTDWRYATDEEIDAFFDEYGLTGTAVAA